MCCRSFLEDLLALSITLAHYEKARPSSPSVSSADSLVFPTSRWPVVFGGLKTGGK